jgi:SNF2 family DNA or RNA helicase
LFLKLPTRIEFDRQLSEGTVLYSDESKIDVTDQVVNNALRLDYLINKHKHCNSSIDSELIVIEEDILKGAFLHIEGSNSLEIMNKLLRYKKGSCNIFLPYLIPFDYSDLFDFQKEGFKWLYSNKKALLADDMGLGKSVQVIAALNHIYNSKRDRASQEKNTCSIILAPKTLIKNWVDQFNIWAPYFRILSIVSTSKDLLSAIKFASANYHVVITNYESVRGNKNILNKKYFDVLICDEAHRLRKSSSIINKIILNSDIDWRWLLTGTPIEKDSLDVLNLASILEPSRISKANTKFSDYKALNLLKKYGLRRTKEELLKNIPEPNEEDVFIELSPCQRKVYDSVIKESLKPKNRDLHLKYFNMLRNVIEYTKECQDNAKIEYVYKLLKNLPKNKKKSIVFSYLLDPLFSLKKQLQKEMKVVLLDGSQSATERFEMVDRFQKTDDIDIILASTRATSEGLTITEAHRVIFLNKWWNPSLNMQARDRVIRIGQTKVIDIINLYVNNTIDKNLLNILDTKEKTWNKLVTEGMSENDVAKLVMESIK